MAKQDTQQDKGQNMGQDLAALLRHAGLRATRPRMELAKLLFTGQDRHLTAESLHHEAQKTGHKMSLATIYNSLHQFTEAGLLRRVPVDATRSYFDTNTRPHHHFYIGAENRLIDIPENSVGVAHLPPVPDGLNMDGVDVIIRLSRDGARKNG